METNLEKRKIKFIVITVILIVIGSFSLIKSVLADETTPKVVINEIAWMGTKESANNEWIELFNPTDQKINLTDWILKAEDGSPEISLKGFIPAQGYFLLERTDDKTLPEIKADQIYKGALSNQGEKLLLYDANSQLIDEIDCSQGWFAGDNQTKASMERIDPSQPGSLKENWQTNPEQSSTPKAPNSTQKTNFETTPKEKLTAKSTTTPEAVEIIPASTPSLPNHPPQAKAGPNQTALVGQPIIFDASLSSDPDNDPLEYFWNFGDGSISSLKKTTHTYHYPGLYLVSLTVSDGELTNTDLIEISVYPTGIVISEFLPNPQGKDKNQEWIEIYNDNQFIVELTGWQIKDQQGKTFTFPEKTFLSPKKYLILTASTTKISLNNEKDTLYLIYPNQITAQAITYEKAKENYSVNLIDSNEYVWSSSPTPGLANLITYPSEENSKNSFNQKNKSSSRVTQPKQTLSSFLLTSRNFLTSFLSKRNQPIFRPVLAKVRYPLPAEITSFSSQNNPNNRLSQPNQNHLANLSFSSIKPKINPEIILFLSILISSSLFGLWLINLRKLLLK